MKVTRLQLLLIMILVAGASVGGMNWLQSHHPGLLRSFWDTYNPMKSSTPAPNPTPAPDIVKAPVSAPPAVYRIPSPTASAHSLDIDLAKVVKDRGSKREIFDNPKPCEA